MDAKEIAEIIDSMVDSIRTSPDQFYVEFHVTGQSILDDSGPPERNIAATGSSIIPPISGSVLGSENNPIIEKIRILTESLSKISWELESQEPDTKTIVESYKLLKSTWAPPLVTAVLDSILRKFISKKFDI